MRNRGFEIVSDFKDKHINLPTRKTSKSAGYDIEAAEDKIIKAGQMAVIATGLKAYMQEDEVLYLYAKSSGFPKKGIMLSNNVGIIDGDYYENESNDGHIMFSIINLKDEDLQIKKGDSIGQAMFGKYLTIDNDNATGVRKGGFGSTSQK